MYKVASTYRAVVNVVNNVKHKLVTFRFPLILIDMSEKRRKGISLVDTQFIIYKKKKKNCNQREMMLK